VNVDLESQTNTGIAMVNTNSTNATVLLSLRNSQGDTISTKTILLGANHQVSEFVTQFFQGVPELLGPFSGLVFIRSDVPVGVLGLTFIGPSFTTLPVAVQLGPTSAALNTSPNIIAVSGTTFDMPNTFTSTIVNPLAVGAGTFTPIQTSPLPSTITQTPATIAGLAATQPPFAITTPLTTTTPIVSPVAIAASGPSGALAFLPATTTTVGGVGSLLLPQIATGGGWVSQIVITNTSSVSQLVRVDFFNSIGGPLVLPFGSTAPSVLVPPGGIAILSTL
jgi:hypothetical protein